MKYIVFVYFTMKYFVSLPVPVSGLSHCAVGKVSEDICVQLLIDFSPTAAAVTCLHGGIQIWQAKVKLVQFWSEVSLFYINTAEHHTTAFSSDTVSVRRHLHISLLPGGGRRWGEQSGFLCCLLMTAFLALRMLSCCTDQIPPAQASVI